MSTSKRYNDDYYNNKYYLLEQKRLKYKYESLYIKKKRYYHDKATKDTFNWYNRMLHKYNCGMNNIKFIFISPDEIEEILVEQMNRLQDILYNDNIRTNIYKNTLQNYKKNNM